MMDSPRRTDPERRPRGAPRPRLPLRAKAAMASFLLSILMCVPLTGVVAVVLGLWVLPRLRDEVHLAGFARAARWGILLGAVNTVVQCMGLAQFQGWYEHEIRSAMEDRTRAAMTAVTSGDAEELLKFWVNTESERPDEATIRAFADALSQRYGALQNVSITHSEFIEDEVGGILAPPQAIGALLLSFENAEVFGEARYRLAVASSPIIPVPYLRSIRLEGRDGPPLTLGAVIENDRKPAPSTDGTGEGTTDESESGGDDS